MKRLFPLIIILISVSCTQRSGDKDTAEKYDRDRFFDISYEDIMQSPAEVRLSEIASDVNYAVLETGDKCLLHPYADYFFTDKYIFIDNVYHILQFTRDGKFIKQIGKQGRGPGEIGLIRMLSVLDNDEQLVAQTNWARKLYYFNYEGEFLKSVQVPDVLNIRILPGRKQLFYDPPNWGNEEFVFLLRSDTGDTLSVVRNHYTWENKSGYSSSIGYHLFTPFYNSHGTVSMKYMYNDTVYKLKNNSIVPEYFINMGKYKLPDEYRVEVAQGGFEYFSEKSKGYRFAVSMEANEKLYIASQEFSNMEEDFQWNMIYDRRSRSGMLITDSQGNPGNLINDIDGGSDFWPKGSVNDSTLFVPLLPHQIIGEKNLEQFSDNPAIDPEKKQQFLEMVKGLKENDNPVLMIVSMKK